MSFMTRPIEAAKSAVNPPIMATVCMAAAEDSKHGEKTRHEEHAGGHHRGGVN